MGSETNSFFGHVLQGMARGGRQLRREKLQGEADQKREDERAEDIARRKTERKEDRKDRQDTFDKQVTRRQMDEHKRERDAKKTRTETLNRQDTANTRADLNSEFKQRSKVAEAKQKKKDDLDTYEKKLKLKQKYEKTGTGSKKIDDDPTSSANLFKIWQKMDKDDQKTFGPTFTQWAMGQRESFNEDIKANSPTSQMFRKGTETGQNIRPGAEQQQQQPISSGFPGLDVYNNHLQQTLQQAPQQMTEQSSENDSSVIDNISRLGNIQSDDNAPDVIDLTEAVDPASKIDPTMDEDAAYASELLTKFNSEEELTPEEEQWLDAWMMTVGLDFDLSGADI